MNYIDPVANGFDPQLIRYLFPKIFISMIVGGVIGFNRQKRGKPAGLKTNIFICVGSCLFAATSLLICGDPSYHADAARIVAQVAPGVGFLGAGTIFKHEDTVIGLTSASLIWVVAALGILIGLGGYAVSLILAFGIAFLLPLLTIIESKLFKTE
jgi:putative Mg2+ transporter-C (MgtC) family protein